MNALSRIRIYSVLVIGAVLVGCTPAPLDNSPRGTGHRIETAAKNMRDLCILLAPEFLDGQRYAFEYAKLMGADAWFPFKKVVQAANTTTGQKISLDRASKTTEPYSCGVLTETVDPTAFRAAILNTVRNAGLETSDSRNDTVFVDARSRKVVRYDITNAKAQLALVFFDSMTKRGLTPAAYLIRTSDAG